MNFKEKQAGLRRVVAATAPDDGVLESVTDEPAVLEGIADSPDVTSEEVDHAREALRRVAAEEDLSEDHAYALEAIILPRQRPVVEIQNGSFGTPGWPFEHFGEEAPRRHIEAAIPAVGRIELPNYAGIEFGGTAFLVGPGLMMTNRHVAELFTNGLGREGLRFKPGQRADIDLLKELDNDGSRIFNVSQVEMIHPYWDMALLRVAGLDEVAPLTLTAAPAADLAGRDVAIVGYPALDPRNDVALQSRIFRDVFNVKRLQPGKLGATGVLPSFGNDVEAVTHDASTLGGNSGSVVIDVETGNVAGLHFAGIYLEANYAVPTDALASDPRVVDAGVQFDDTPNTGATAWDSHWTTADPGTDVIESEGAAGPADQPSSSTASPPAADGMATFTIPLEITVRIAGDSSQVTAGVGATSTVHTDVTEKMVEPYKDEDFSGRTGYDEDFLGILVPMPEVKDTDAVSKLDDGEHHIPYEHFSVVMHKERRLAVFTASNIDANPDRKQPEPGKDYTRKGLSGLRDNDREKWSIDPRIPAIHQLPDKFFTKDRTAWDKGHIVRRDDVAWGDSYEEVRRANGDTYHVTNCSPQHKGFNRSNLKGTWGLLENLVLKQAKAEQYCVFGGPVLADDDRLFEGYDDDGRVDVPIPSKFWKVVVARNGDVLECFAFLLDQDLADVSWTVEFAVNAEWRSRMISIPELEEVIGLATFPEVLHHADQIDADHGEGVRSTANVDRFET